MIKLIICIPLLVVIAFFLGIVVGMMWGIRKLEETVEAGGGTYRFRNKVICVYTEGKPENSPCIRTQKIPDSSNLRIVQEAEKLRSDN